MLGGAAAQVYIVTAIGFFALFMRKTLLPLLAPVNQLPDEIRDWLNKQPLEQAKKLRVMIENKVIISLDHLLTALSEMEQIAGRA